MSAITERPLSWLPRTTEPPVHTITASEFWGTEEQAPCVIFEKRPLLNPKGETVEKLYVAWITLNNPGQYN